MCEFCDKAKNFFDKDDKYDARIRVFCEGKGKDLVCLNKETGEGVVLHIAFCPMCGRSLEEEKELPWVTVGNWKHIDQVKEIGKSEEKIDVANFEPDYKKNAVYLEDDCK